MLRRLIVPIFLILVVAGVGSMCTAISGAKVRRRLLQHRDLSPTAVATTPASPVKDSARAGEGQIVACPEQLPDMAAWRRMTPDGAPIVE